MPRLLLFLLSALLLLQVSAFAQEDDSDAANAPVVRRKITTLFSEEELAGEQKTDTVTSAVEPQVEPRQAAEAAAPQPEPQVQITPQPSHAEQPKEKKKNRTKSKTPAPAKDKSALIKPGDPLDKEEVVAGISAIQKQISYREELEDERRQAERVGDFR